MGYVWPFISFYLLLARLYESTGSFCCYFDVGISITIKFYFKVFYVMGKALSGEVPCTWTGPVMFC